MTYKELKEQTKFELKELAEDIRSWKDIRKPKNREDGVSQWEVDSAIFWRKRDFRHLHIAYCEFFNNTPYEKIEKSCHESPDRGRIDGYKNDWIIKINEETLRHCA